MKHSIEQCVSSCPFLNFISPGVGYPNVYYGFCIKKKMTFWINEHE